MKTSGTPASMVKVLTDHREVLRHLVTRGVRLRYRGTVLGILGAFLQPLVMLGLYTIVFTVVFQPRFPVGSESDVPNAVIFFAGLLVHSLVAEPLQAAPGLVLGQPSLVTKSVFPLETLAIASVSETLFHTGVSFVMLTAVMMLLSDVPPTAALLPFVLLPVTMVGLGTSWLVSAVAVYVRDIGQYTGLLSTALLFSSPVLFPMEAVPAQWRYLLYGNPITPGVEQVRDVLLRGEVPPLWAWGSYLAFGAATMCGGYAVFQRLRRSFADVI